jgi:FkbM family methyltransferase
MVRPGCHAGRRTVADADIRSGAIRSGEEARMRAAKSWLKQLAFRRGYTIGRTDPESTLGLYVVSLILHLGINCVFDVGAHFGEFGADLRKYGYKGPIVSFEPVRENLIHLVRRRRHDPTWSVYPFALGAQDEVRPINVTKGTNFSSFLTPNDRAAAVFAESAVERADVVQIRRLDAVFDACTAALPNPAVYLKMDTQGWDLEVVKGASGRLAQIRALQTEMSVLPLYEHMPTYIESILFLNQQGFDLSAMYKVSRDTDLRLIEFDCVMVNSGVHAHRLSPSHLTQNLHP